MNTRYFHQRRPRSGLAAVGHIAFADEDDGLIETWMIGPGNEISSERRTPLRSSYRRR
jgi:hypothetical protein